MYAIIADSGSQFYVEKGHRLLIDHRTVEPGQSIEFDRVLMVGGDGEPRVGQPVLAGAKVIASVLGHPRGKKLHVRTYKRRKNSRKHRGHRQHYTEIEVQDIIATG